MLPFQQQHRHDDVLLDRTMKTSVRGRWALNATLVGLGVTALFRLAIVLLSGSVGLLADGIHTMTTVLIAALPWIVLTLSRRSASRSSPSGSGRAENVAGGSSALIILLCSLFTVYKCSQKLFHPEPLRDVWWVIAAALVSFVGNGGMAMVRRRLGSQIGSAALGAGSRARMDGWTGLAVVLGAVGSVLGFPPADPLIGLLIAMSSLFAVRKRAVTIRGRMRVAADPELAEEVKRLASTEACVQEVRDGRVRWRDHLCSTALPGTGDGELSPRESHQRAEQVRHTLFDAHLKLAAMTVSVNSCGPQRNDPYASTLCHAQDSPLASSGASEPWVESCMVECGKDSSSACLSGGEKEEYEQA